MRFGTEPLVDHHCHGIVQRDLDRLEFESMLSEASHPSPLGTSLFDSMIGLAIRRWCAPELDLEPLAPAEAYLARRQEIGSAEVARRFLRSARVTDFVVDTGFVPETLSEPSELAALAGGRAHPVVRLETLAEELLAEGTSAEFGARLVHRLSSSNAVGAKSVAAYRTGLSLPPVKPSENDLARALDGLHPGPGGTYRIRHPVVHAYLAWTAIELGMPLQFHVGYGDNDADLDGCDPLLLTQFLRATQRHGVPVMLLHNYPFHRHASYLAQVFDHVFMDVGLATHNTGALSQNVISEALELVPFGKMVYSSDAFGLAELHFLGAHLFRRGLSKVADSLVARGDMSDADAVRLCALIGRDNARRAYGLDAPQVR